MPGHKVARSSIKNGTLFDKYQCPHCIRLLKDAVQPLCGHWLCESCAEDLLASSTPKCPRSECQEDLKSDSDEGAYYFPDRFVRREIEGLEITCTYKDRGCSWEDKLAKFEAHLKNCEYAFEECPQCGETIAPDLVDTHERVCPKAIVQCPLAHLGCSHSGKMTRSELKQHVSDHGIKHLEVFADVVKLLQKGQEKKGNKVDLITAKVAAVADDGLATGQLSERYGDMVEKDSGPPQTKGPRRTDCDQGYESLRPPLAKTIYLVEVEQVQANTFSPGLYHSALPEVVSKLDGSLRSELRRKDEEIGILRNTITKPGQSIRFDQGAHYVPNTGALVPSTESQVNLMRNSAEEHRLMAAGLEKQAYDLKEWSRKSITNNGQSGASSTYSLGKACSGEHPSMFEANQVSEQVKPNEDYKSFQQTMPEIVTEYESPTESKLPPIASKKQKQSFHVFPRHKSASETITLPSIVSNSQHDAGTDASSTPMRAYSASPRRCLRSPQTFPLIKK